MKLMKKFFYGLFGIIIFVLLVTPIIRVYAADQTGGAYDNPTQDAVDSSPQVSISPDQVDTSVNSVSMTFTGLSSDHTYKYCLQSDLTKCKDDQLKDIDSNTDIRAGAWHVTVCGDGADALKTNCDNGDYFHAGSTYQVNIYADGDTSPMQFQQDPSFSVLPLFPKVIFQASGGTHTIGIDEQSGDITYDGKDIQDMINSDSGISNPTINNPVAVSMSTDKKIAGGSKTNDYRMDLNSGALGYSNHSCVNVNNTPDGALSKPFQFMAIVDNGTSTNQTVINYTGPLATGDYDLKIQDQVHDSTSFFGKLKNDIVYGGNCNSGFVYYTIPISIDDKGQATIDLANVEADPDNWYLSNTNKQDLGVLPCAVGTDDQGNTVTVNTDDVKQRIIDLKKITHCTEYQTAIGTIGITPYSFIQTFAKLLLEIGIVATLGYLIYGSWLILTSRGDKEKIQKAREMITSAIIGLIFIFLSFAILGFIGVDILHLPGFSR